MAGDMTEGPAAIDALCAEKPDHDLIVISHPIERGLHQKLTAFLEKNRQLGGSRKRRTIFFSTYGGDAHAGFRVARCLRHHCSGGRLVVTSC